MRSPMGPSSAIRTMQPPLGALDPHFRTTRPLCRASHGSRLSIGAMEPPQGRTAKVDATVERVRPMGVDALAVARRLGAELDRLDEAVEVLRATRLRQLAAARSRRPAREGCRSPAPDP